MVASWVILLALLVAWVVVPEFRSGLRIWLWLYLLLVAWFVLARTKTVSWQLVAGVFSVSVPWSFVITGVSVWLSGQVSEALGVRAGGAATVIAGMAEESLKLVPLAVLVAAAPGRVRRFAAVDWLLVGFASGLAFQAVEELARRTALGVLNAGLLGEMMKRLIGMGPGSGYPQYGFSLLAGGSSNDSASYAGHGVFTALVAATVGLGVAAWRRGRRIAAEETRAGSRTRAAMGWRLTALVAPLVVWWLVVVDHAGFNASAATGRGWVDLEGSTMPWLIRVTWDWSGQGDGRGWLLLALLLVALLVDARRLQPTPGEAAGPRGLLDGDASELIAAPERVAARWAASLPRLREAASASQPASTQKWRAKNAAYWTARQVNAAMAAACALVAYTLRDLLVIVGTHARQPGESRLSALARGRLAIYALAEARKDAIDAAAPADTLGRRRVTRLIALGGLGFLLAAAVLVAPALADQVGNSLLTPGSWLAGLFDHLGDWWDGIGPVGQILVGVGLAGLVALSGGSLGLAFGLAGATTFLFDKRHGLSTFLRNPGAATRDYFATTTPLGMVLDLAETLFTFAPGNFAGASAGQFGRRLILETAVGKRAINVKILYGEQPKPHAPGTTPIGQEREIIGAHSPRILTDPNFKVHSQTMNPDGTTSVRFRKILQKASPGPPPVAEVLSKTKFSNLAPSSWSDVDIIRAGKKVAKTPPVLGPRATDGATLHRDIVNGVQWEVIKNSSKRITSSFPTGGTPMTNF